MIIMKFSRKLLTLLAIFCVIISAGAVCATDVADEIGNAASQYPDNSGQVGSQYNETLENASGEPVNATNATPSHTMPTTGNPILALFATVAVLGGYTVIRRK